MLTWLGLRARLALLVLLTLLPVIALLAWSALQSRHSAFELAHSRLQSQALLVAAHQQRLVQKVGLPALGSALGPVSALPGATALLLDPQGAVLAADPPAPAWLGRPHPDAVVQQAVQAQLQGVHQARDAQADQRIYAFAPVPGGGAQSLMVVISLPHALVAAQSRATLALELLIMLVMLLAGMAIAWCMGHRLIVHPVQAIGQAADDIGRGNLAARVPLHAGSARRPDEIARIALALNRMAESLQAQRAELDAALRDSDKERALLDLVLNSMSDGVIAVDTAGRFLLFNDWASQLHNARPQLGSSLAQWRHAHELLLLDGQTLCPVPERPLVQAMHGVSLDNQELVLRSAGRPDRVLRMSTRPLHDAQGALIGGIAVFNDITQLKAAENFAQAQEQVLGLIAAGASLGDALRAIVRLIEESSPGSWCSVLQVDGEQLSHGVAVSLPPAFVKALDGLPIGPGQGACGSAAFHKAAVVVEDVASDPLMQDYRALLLAHGLHACWATPVLCSAGEVLATFAIYRRAPGRPQPADLELIATASRLARIALARAQAEAALVSSEAQFRELADNIEDVFYNVDTATGQVRYISPGYEKVWGRSSQSLYANPASYLDAVLPEDRAVLAQADALNAQGKASDVKYRILGAQGQLRWIRDHSYPVFNAAGALERVVGTARDITENERAKLALAATNRALQMLSRTSIAIHRIRDETELLAEACRVAVEIGGYRMAWVGYAQDDEARSVTPMACAGDEGGYLDGIEISWSADRASGQGPCGQALRSGQPAQRSDIGGDSSYVWQAAALQRGYRSSIGLPLREGGRSFGVLSLYRHDTEFFTDEEVALLQELADTLAFGIGSLRAHEAILSLNASLEERVRQRTAQLQQANEQLEAFSYSVSHDLRGPLGTMDGFGQLLQKSITRLGAGDPQAERCAHYLAQIRSGVAQMGELIEAMLALAQVSRAGLRRETVDLSALAEALLAGYQAREPARQVCWRVAPGLLAQGDGRLLKQVLDNLLGNAWKFSAGQACAEIALDHEKGPDGQTVYGVYDNGAGFDMACSAKLFGAFQRLHAQSEFAGTGIGLATVARIVERHGGRIWAESAPGQGARFYFTLGAQPG